MVPKSYDCEHPYHVEGCTYAGRGYDMENVPISEFILPEVIDGATLMPDVVGVYTGIPVTARPRRFRSTGALNNTLGQVIASGSKLYIWKTMWHPCDGLHYWAWYSVKLKPE